MVFASSDVGIETIAVLGFDAMKLLYLLDDRYQKGMEEGMAKGEEVGKSQRSIEIAKNMLAKGMDEATIQEITGLTEDQILQIQ